MNIAYMLRWAAARYRDRVAFQMDDLSRTYGEIDDRSNALANALIGLGVGKGDRVGIFLGNQIEYAEAEFAVTKAGAVRVPMLIKSSEEEIRHYVEFASAKVVIASDHVLPVLREVCESVTQPPMIVAAGEAAEGEHGFETLIGGAPATPPEIDLVDTDWYAIRFTGGTTGQPKGVLMGHRTMVSIIQNMLMDWTLPEDEVVCHFHPLSHAAGMMMYTWWMRGARQVILPAFSFKPEELMRTIEQERVTAVFMIPTALNTVLDSGIAKQYDHSSLRMIVYGGAPIAGKRLSEGLETFGPVFVQIYGSTEAPNVLTTLSQREHTWPAGQSQPDRLRSAGRIGCGVEVRVVDEEGNECAAGEPGQVVSRGPHTFFGYWQNEELTESRVRDGWVNTRDIGYFDADGYLYLVDRADDVIITGGFNVWPAEVENVVCTHPGVAEAAVFGLPDDRWGEAVTAVVVPRPGVSLDEADVAQFTKDRLTTYKAPKRIIVRDEPIPKSQVGKLLRRRVRDEYASTLAG